MVLNKYLNYLWTHRRQFVRYFFVGVSGTFLDILSLWILKEFFGLIPVVAVVINQVFVLLFIFFLNKKYSFQADGEARKQMIKFFVVATGNYIFAIFWMWFWNQNFGFNYLIVRIVNIALAVAWNFLLYKEWVYKEYNPNTTNAYPNDTNIKNSNINSLR